MVAIKRNIVEGKEGREVLAGGPLSDTAPSMKVVKILEMCEVVLAEMLHSDSVGELLSSHTTLYARPHEVIEPQRHAAPPAEPSRELSTKFGWKCGEDSGIPAPESDRASLLSPGVCARRTAVYIPDEPEGLIEVDNTAW